MRSSKKRTRSCCPVKRRWANIPGVAWEKDEGGDITGIDFAASPEEIVRPLCRYLGIEDVIATRTEVDVDGRYTGNIELYAYGSAKAEAMAEMAASEGIDLSDSYAYSDSLTDLPMLETVGHPVAVNPDPELEKIAIERGWEVRRFESAVTIRDRLPVKTVSGVAVAGGVAAVTYWVIRMRKRRG